MRVNSFENSDAPVISGNTVQYDGASYTLVSLDKQQAINTNISEENIQHGLLAIEDGTIFHYNIPKQYLQYCVINEILCPDLRSSVTGRCAETLKLELEYVPGSMIQEYVDWRINFFQSMCNYYTQDFSDAVYAQEMQLCIDYLKGYHN